MRIEGFQTWEVENERELETILKQRDRRGGGDFWLIDPPHSFLSLAFTVTGPFCAIHFFHEKGHPGYRCLGGDGLPTGGATQFIYDGCDPYCGLEVPNEYVLSFESGLQVALEFFRTGKMDCSVQWFEL